MEVMLWVMVCILLICVGILSVKIYMLEKSAQKIEESFIDKLAMDTNTLIDIPTNNKHMRSLANTINRQLRILRFERHRFYQGDLELKNAVTNISHDLRTPLTAIFGYLDLLEKEEKSETVTRYIGVIRNRSEMLMLLTEELFRYSVILSTEKHMTSKPVTVNRVLEESIAAFYTDLNKRNIIPKIRIPEEKIIRILDASALSRVFANLMNNAIKYSGGDLEISLYKSGEIIFSNTAGAVGK